MTSDSTRRDVLGAVAALGAGLTTAPVAGAQGTSDDHWQQTIEESGSLDELDDVVALDDGSLLAVGRSQAEYVDSAWAVRLDPGGSVRWSETFQAVPDSSAKFRAVTPTGDGGALAVGEARVEREGERVTAGWAAKLTREGSLGWESAFVGPGETTFADVARDGDQYVLAGDSAREEGSDRDAFVVAIDAAGDERWRTRTTSALGHEEIGGVAAGENGYCVVGDAVNWDGDDDVGRQGFAATFASGGQRLWQSTYGGSRADDFSDVAADGEGGYVVVGSVGTGVSLDSLGTDALAIRVDGTGEQQWETTFGDDGFDWLTAVEATEDGFVVAGLHETSASADGRGDEAWLAGIDPSGDRWFATDLGNEGRGEEGDGLALLDSGRAVVVGRASTGEDERLGFAASAAVQENSGALGALPGFGVGAALGAVGLGAGLVEARRRLSDRS